MMARSSKAPSIGRIQMRKTNLLQIIIFDLQRAAGPYRWAKQTCIAAKTALPAVAVSSLRFLRRIDRLGRNPRRAFTRPVVLAFDACPVNNARACESSSPDLIRPQESNLAIVRDLKPNPIFRQTPDYRRP